jgi:hypothetical protein
MAPIMRAGADPTEADIAAAGQAAIAPLAPLGIISPAVPIRSASRIAPAIRQRRRAANSLNQSRRALGDIAEPLPGAAR